MNSTKKLTEAALLTSLFIVITIIAVGTGIGYAAYLDFAVPIFFCIILLKCDFKYTVLSSISALLIVSLVLGNIGTAIWISQSIIIGILCGVLLTKNTSIIDDFVYGSIIGVMLMVFVDIYGSTLIGYSFMEEFQGYANMLKNPKFINIVFYTFIALLPMGTIFCVYFLALILGKKLNLLKGNSKKKLYMMSNFKTCGRYMCCSKKVFYTCASYILFIEILNLFGVKFEQTYIKTILISSEYVCIYFVIRDAFVLLQNYLLIKYNKVSYLRILSIVVFLSLIFSFKITTVVLVIINIILDKKIDIRIKQNIIVNNYVNKLICR